jgi:hypothetical protein
MVTKRVYKLLIPSTSEFVIIGLLALMIIPVSNVLAGHGEETAIISVDENNLAISGYDTVAYFTESHAVAGSEEFTYNWRGADWHFAKAQHRALFISNPEKYAPQYGAFCALGVTLNAAVPVDPEAWTIVEEKLFLNYNVEFRDKWRLEQQPNIEKADLVWADHNTGE